jgi:hypothetical protein
MYYTYIYIYIYIYEQMQSEAYLNLLLGGETQIFSLIQAQNVQVKFLVIFK